MAQVVAADDMARSGAPGELEVRPLTSAARCCALRPADRRRGFSFSFAVGGECFACVMQEVPGVAKRRSGRSQPVRPVRMADDVPAMPVADRSAVPDPVHDATQPMHPRLVDVSLLAQDGQPVRATDGCGVPRLAAGNRGQLRSLDSSRVLRSLPLGCQCLAVRTRLAQVSGGRRDRAGRERRDRQLIIKADGRDDEQNQSENGCRQQPTTIGQRTTSP